MDDKYIKDIYDNLGGESVFGNYNDYYSLITTDDSYIKDVYNSKGESVFGSYNDFVSLVKKKDELQPTAQEVVTESITEEKTTPTSLESSESLNQSKINEEGVIAGSDLFTAKPLKEDGFGEYIVDALDVGISTVSKSIYDAPALIYDAFATITNPIARTLGIEETSSEKFAETFDLKNIPSEIVGERIAKKQKEIQEYSDKNGGDALTALENGNILGAAKMIAGTTAQSLPLMVPAFLSGGSSLGLGVVGASTASTKAAQLKEENPDMDVASRTINATATGMLEATLGQLLTGASGAVTKRILAQEGSKKGAKIITDSFRGILEEGLEKSPIASLFGEMLEEGLVSVGEQLTDISTGVKNDFDFREVVNSSISATGMGGVNTVSIYGSKGYVAANEYAKLKKLNKKLSKLSSELDNSDLSVEEKDLLKKSIERLKSAGKNIIDDAIANVSLLPEEQRKELENTILNLDNISVSAFEINSNNKIPKEVKKVMLDELKAKAIELTQKKDNILTKNYRLNEFESLPDSEKIKLKEEAASVLFKQYQDSGQTNINITDDQISRKALDIFTNKKELDAIQEQETRDIPDAQPAEGVQGMETEIQETAVQKEKIKIEDTQKEQIEKLRQQEIEEVELAIARSNETGEIPVVKGEPVNQNKIEDINKKYDKELETDKETAQYLIDLKSTKNSDPTTYWSVSDVELEVAEDSTIVDTEDGSTVVKPDGDIAGLFKKATSKAKGVAQDLLRRAVEAGGRKLDNFDGYLTKQYEKAGFRVVARTPFNKKHAPFGWNQDKHGTPDVVAMIYDPNNELDIEERMFDDPENGYEQMIDYRDSLLPESKVTEKETKKVTAKVTDGVSKLRGKFSKKPELDKQVDSAKKALSKVVPDVEIIISKSEQDYAKVTGETGRKQKTGGTYQETVVDGKVRKVIYINPEKANARTVAHETFHAILLNMVNTDAEAQRLTEAMMKAVSKVASPELKAFLDAFASNYDQNIRSEEKLAELVGKLASEYDSLPKPTKNVIKRWLDRLAKMFGLKPFTDNEVIDVLNTIAGKVARGEAVTQQDLSSIQSNAKKEIIKSRKQTFSKASSSEMFENPDILQPKREANGRTKVIELGKAFDKRAKDNGYYIPIPKDGVYTDAQLNAIAEAMADDAQLQLLQDDSGIGWYDLKTRSAMELMSRIHPELSDSNSKPHLEFTLMVALISQNNSVVINFRQANEAYTYYKNNNKLPTKPYAGKSGNIIKKNIALAFEAIKKKGWKKYKNTLQETKTVKEWESEGYKVNGENKTTKITGAMAILGSKIGSFWGNLNGDFNTLTADLWFSRMFNRYTGNVVAKKATEKSKQTTLDELKKYKDKTLLNGYKKSDILKGGKVFDNWLNTIVKNYADGGYKDKQRLNIVSNTHFKNTKGELQDIPRGGKERNTMRDVVKRVQGKLIERGYPKLDIADIQAIVWYNEKDLYRQYKAVNKSSEKTDYETAAQEVLREQGVNAEVALPFKTSKSSADGGRKQTDRIQPKSLSEKVEPTTKSRKQLSGKPSIDEVRKFSKKNNISDTDTNAYLKELGYTDKEILGEGITVTEIRERSEASIKAKKKKDASIVTKTREKLLDRQARIKGLLKGINSKESKKAIAKIVTKAGATGYASFRFKEAEKKIYEGLSNEDSKNLDEIIYASRIVSINKNRSDRGLDPYTGIEGYNEVSAQRDLDDKKQKLGDKKFKELKNRSDIYFTEFNNSLKRMFDSGLISEEVYNQLKDLDYSPIKTIKYIIPENSSSEEIDRVAISAGVTKDAIKNLGDSNVNDIITDTKWLLATNLSMIEAKIFENSMLNAFEDAINSATETEKIALNEYILDNPVVGKYKDGRPKRKYDDKYDNINYTKVYYKKDGVDKYFVMKKIYAEQLLDVKIKQSQTSDVISKLTGTQVLRFFATSGNPLFIVGNTAVDFNNILFLSDTYSNFKLLGGAELAYDFVSNSLGKVFASESYKKSYNEFMEHGGSIDYLSVDGLKALQNLDTGMKPIKKATDILKSYGKVLSYLGETSEISFRIAVYEKSKSNQLKKLGKKPTDQEMEDIMFEAAREARETIDFSQGGSATKAADKTLPYLNAATQGLRKGLDYANDNPAGFASSMLQAMLMSGGLMAGSLLMLLSGLDDEDEVDEVLERISEYEKSNYHIIFTGDKDKDGEYEYYRVKKLPTISVFSTLAEQLVTKSVLNSRGVEYDVDGGVMEKSLKSAMPIIPTPKEFLQRNPLLSSVITYSTNYDFFYDKPIFQGPRGKNIAPSSEGLYDPKVNQIYKDWGQATGMSPARSKAALEKIITSESTNPVVGLIYSGYDAAFKDDTPISEDFNNAKESLFKNVSKKLKRKTNKNLRVYNERAKDEEPEMIIETEIYNKEQKIYQQIVSKHKNNEELTNNELKNIVEENFDKKDWKKYYRKYYIMNKKKDVDRGLLDILYESTPEVQALKLFKRFGNSLDADEYKELKKVSIAARRKLSKKAYKIYKDKYTK